MNTRLWKLAALTLVALAVTSTFGCAKRPGPGGAPSAGLIPATGTSGGGSALAFSDSGASTESLISAAQTDRESTRAQSAASTVEPRNDGRPAPAEYAGHSALKDVFFDFDRYDLGSTATRTLEETASWLKDNGKFLVLIEGHADERGTSEYNLTLGERRAKAVMNFLAARGVTNGRLAMISYGEDRPQCGDRSEPCWAKNRRAHFLLKSQ